MKIWKHRLTPGLVNIFMKFVEAIKSKGINNVHLQDEVHLTKNEYNNFQKLRYFGLVAKGEKTGNWVLTKRGLAFVRSEEPVSLWVGTFRNLIEERSEETVYINNFINKGFLGEWFQKEFDFDISQGKLI